MEKVLPKGWGSFNISMLTGYNGLFSDGDWVESKDQDPNGDVRLIQLADIGENEFKDKSNRFLNQEKADELKCTFLKKNDVLIARMPDPIGRSCTFPLSGKYATVVDIAIVRFDQKYFNPFLFSYLVNSPSIRMQMLNLASGSTRQRISRRNLDTILFPLPPLSEQERIVEKLDKLFFQHEKIKKALDRIPQLLKTFRQQVLTQAVTGKLTKQWREGKKLKEWNPTLKKHNTKNLLDDKSQGYILPEIPKEWKWVTIMQLADVKGGKRLPKGEKLVNYDTGFPYIKAGDIKNGNVNSVNLEYLLEATHEKIKNYIVNSGDILITNVGACIGDIGIVPTNLNGANQTENALKLCNFIEVKVKYLSFWLRSPIAQNYISQTVLSAGLGKLALGRIQVFPVPLSNIVEQQEIVHKVESLFAKADAIDARYEKLKAKVDNLPQAILHKAFKGELVPQLPTDGDAKDLLAEIMALKAETKRNK